MKKKTHFRVITPNSFSNIDSVTEGESRLLKTVEDAQAEIERFGNVSKKSEHYDYWQQQKSKCKIVKVTEFEEELDDIQANLKFYDSEEVHDIGMCACILTEDYWDFLLTTHQEFLDEGSVACMTYVSVLARHVNAEIEKIKEGHEWDDLMNEPQKFGLEGSCWDDFVRYIGAKKILEDFPQIDIPFDELWYNDPSKIEVKMKPIKLKCAFGSAMVREIEEQDWKYAEKEKEAIDGVIEEWEFKTQAEAEAFTNGADRMDGWNNYLIKQVKD